MARDDRSAEGRLDGPAQGGETSPERQRVVGRLRLAPGAVRPRTSTGFGLVLVVVGVAVTALVAGMVIGSGAGPDATTPFASDDPSAPISTETLATGGPAESPSTAPSEPSPSGPALSEQPSTAPAPSPSPWTRPLTHANEPGCSDREADASGGYEARAGWAWINEGFESGATPWHYLNDRFHLADGVCGHESALTIQASIVGELFTDACHWRGTGEQGRWDFVPDAIATQELLSPTTPSRVTVRIRYGMQEPATTTKATTFQISVPADFEVSGCDDGTLKLWRTNNDPPAPDAVILPGQVMTIWIVNIRETALVFTAAEWPDEMAQPMRDLLDHFRENLFILVRKP